MTQFFGKVNSSEKLIKIPKNVEKETQIAFKLKKLGFKGGHSTGWKRATQLTGNLYIPIEDLLFMRNWYARHIFTSYPSFKQWIDAGKPLSKEWHNKRGIISWLIWGGDSGLEWVNKKTNMLNKFYNKEYKLIT